MQCTRKTNGKNMKVSRTMRSLSLALLALLLVIGVTIGGAFWWTAGGDANTTVADLTGYWAIDFDEPRKNLEETILVKFTHDGDKVIGTALDPDLIVATISGTAKSGRIEFLCIPSLGAPDSTFEGKVTGANSMKGTWQLTTKASLIARRRVGTWSAQRLAPDEVPAVTIDNRTEFTFTVSSEEYDNSFSWTHTNRDSDAPYEEMKLSRKVEGGYEVQAYLDALRREYNFLSDLIRINRENSPEAVKVHRRTQSRINAIVNQNGYPWSLDRSSRTIKFPKDEENR